MKAASPGPDIATAHGRARPTEAPPVRHAPSSRRRRHHIAALALVAAAISLYMGLYQWGVIRSVWDPVFGAGTQTVLQSSEAEVMEHFLGIPDAVMGSWGFLTAFGLCIAGSARRWQFRPWLVMLFGLDAMLLALASMTLVILQGVSAGAWCLPCLVTASISLLLAYLAHDEVLACLRYLKAVWDLHHDTRLTWDVFRGVGSARAWALAKEMWR